MRQQIILHQIAHGSQLYLTRLLKIGRQREPGFRLPGEKVLKRRVFSAKRIGRADL